jgi:hypothetical protein
MSTLDYGQPLGGVTQAAYIVEDLETSMKDFTDLLNVGPWFVTGPFVPAAGIYRGEPTKMKITLAVAFSGHLMLELIQQHDELPSVYREKIDKTGYGFHHYAVPTRHFDADIARYQSMGYELAFSDVSPRGARVAYMDSSRPIHGMIELVEMSDRLEAIYTAFYHASVGWDGKDPVRKTPLSMPAVAVADAGAGAGAVRPA